jgi:UDP-glucuronate 4-epimerase
MKILVTGCAGFIGMHATLRLLGEGHEVVGVDNLNDYYSVDLKQARLGRLSPHRGFEFIRLDIADVDAMRELFAASRPQRVLHLAAQPGMRYSLKNPHAYLSSNLAGFLNVLEGCRAAEVAHLAYASSSSVYGGNAKLPFSEHDNVDHPISLYAATKKSNELMAHAYSHLFGLPTTGLRLFTVYGPWGRPDMSPSLFARSIFEGTPIKIFNHGDMQRDFTYIDDAVEGIVRLLDRPATPDPEFDPAHPDPASSAAPYRIYNVGNHQPVNLKEYIAAIEKAAGKQAIRDYQPVEAGDMLTTYADTAELFAAVGFTPATPLSVGIERFIAWFKDYYRYA